MPKRWCSILHPSRRDEENTAGFGDAADATDAGFNDEDAADAGFNDEEDDADDAADADGFGFGDV